MKFSITTFFGEAHSGDAQNRGIGITIGRIVAVMDEDGDGMGCDGTHRAMPCGERRAHRNSRATGPWSRRRDASSSD